MIQNLRFKTIKFNELSSQVLEELRIKTIKNGFMKKMVSDIKSTDRFVNSNCLIIIAYNGPNIIAWCYLDDTWFKNSFLIGAYTQHQYRRKGIASYLISRMKIIAEQNYWDILSGTNMDNPNPGNSLYRKMGIK